MSGRIEQPSAPGPMKGPPPRMYTELAPWWPLLSAPEDYAEEADFIRGCLAAACDGPVGELLELGAGGGNTASHLKAHYRLTLVDRSADMVAVSRALNPGCAHHVGDMRTLRLGRAFDAVLIHDAVMYLLTEADLAAACATAHAHCRPGGALLLLPDCVAETFRPETDHGGHDEPSGAGLRYLEWSWDPDPTDTSFQTLYAIALRTADGDTRVVEDRHTLGLFPRATWLAILGEAGFETTTVDDPWGRLVFVARRPAA